MSSPDYLTPAQLVARWNGAVTTGTLSNWRNQKRGPAFMKFGRSVRYPMSGVVAYEAAATNDNSDAEKKTA